MTYRTRKGHLYRIAGRKIWVRIRAHDRIYRRTGTEFRVRKHWRRVK